MPAGRPKNSPVASGRVLPPSPGEVRALRETLGITRWEFAELARVALQNAHERVEGQSKGWRRGRTSSTVECWERGTRRMPAPAWELVLAKAALIELGLAARAEVLSQSLPDILARLGQKGS